MTQVETKHAPAVYQPHFEEMAEWVVAFQTEGDISRIINELATPILPSKELEKSLDTAVRGPNVLAIHNIIDIGPDRVYQSGEYKKILIELIERAKAFPRFKKALEMRYPIAISDTDPITSLSQEVDFYKRMIADLEIEAANYLPDTEEQRLAEELKTSKNKYRDTTTLSPEQEQEFKKEISSLEDKLRSPKQGQLELIQNEISQLNNQLQILYNNHKLYKQSQEATNVLIRSNYRLIVKCAQEFTYLLPLTDLIQVGYEGLLKAIDNFNPKKGSFSNYVWTCASGEMLNLVKQQAFDIRITPQIMKEMKVLQDIQDRLVQGGEESNAKRVAQELVVIRFNRDIQTLVDNEKLTKEEAKELINNIEDTVFKLKQKELKNQPKRGISQVVSEFDIAVAYYQGKIFSDRSFHIIDNNSWDAHTSRVLRPALRKVKQLFKWHRLRRTTSLDHGENSDDNLPFDYLSSEIINPAQESQEDLLLTRLIVADFAREFFGICNKVFPDIEGDEIGTYFNQRRRLLLQIFLRIGYYYHTYDQMAEVIHQQFGKTISGKMVPRILDPAIINFFNEYNNTGQIPMIGPISVAGMKKYLQNKRNDFMLPIPPDIQAQQQPSL